MTSHRVLWCLFALRLYGRGVCTQGDVAVVLVRFARPETFFIILRRKVWCASVRCRGILDCHLVVGPAPVCPWECALAVLDARNPFIDLKNQKNTKRTNKNQKTKRTKKTKKNTKTNCTRLSDLELHGRRLSDYCFLVLLVLLFFFVSFGFSVFWFFFCFLFFLVVLVLLFFLVLLVLFAF